MRRAPRGLQATVFAVALIVIAGFLFFQYGMHLAPCELCLQERWPWYIAVAAAALLLVAPRLMPAKAAAAAFLALFGISAGLALRHAAVEWHWIPGPASCTAAPLSGSLDDVRRALMATPPVLCDVAAWSLFGISMAGWNAVVSIMMAGLALGFLRRARRRF